MLLTPPFPPLLWGGGLLTVPAVDLEPGLYADEVEAALESVTGGALDEEDFFAEHDVDLLALPYYVPFRDGRRWYGRLTQRAGHVCDRARMTPVCEWVFVDLDPDDPEPWSEHPDPEEFDLPEYVDIAYTTPKGVRLVVHTDPFPATHYHNVHAHVAGHLEVAGRLLRSDASGGQWNRLQRLPRSTRSDNKYNYAGPIPARVWRKR